MFGENISHASSVVTAKIAEIAQEHAESQDNPAGATSAVIECMVAAAAPLISGLFSGGTIQERLLFSLVMAGSCASIHQHDSDNFFGLQVDISPETLNEAFNTYTKLTGSDIKQFLPKPMLDFAASRVLN